MAVDIDTLQIQIEASSSDAAQKISQLATALSGLKAVAKGGAGLTTTTKQLQALSSAAKLINSTNLDATKLKEFSEAMNSLANIQKATGLNSTINSLRKLPEISESLKQLDMKTFAEQIRQVTSAIQPLATEMQKVASGFAAFPERIQKFISSSTQVVASNTQTSKSFGILGTGISSSYAKFGILLIGFRRIASVMASWVTEANDYIENINLFNVSMGKYAEEAQNYAQKVADVMGIDPSEWMRNQAIFQTLLTGFGVVSDRATIMSKNLTQLGYDISSFFNITYEDAMQKLQSGISGELEPLRRLGYDLSQARLEAIALSLGIDKSVTSMTQAEKSQLRYYAIMTQVTTAQGDMARTLEAPANQMRIFSASVTQAARALGNILIPVMNAVLPAAIALINVIRNVAESLASLFGFKLTTVDYSGASSEVTDSLEETEEAAGGASKALKQYMLGIDELNVIDKQSGGGGGASGALSDLEEIDFDIPVYDFLDGVTKRAEDLEDVMEEVLKIALLIGAAFLAWKIANALSEATKLKNMLNQLKLLATGIVIYLEFTLGTEYYRGWLSGEDLWGYVKWMLLTGASTGILYAMWGPAGGAIGLAVGILASINAITAEIKEGNVDLSEMIITTLTNALLGGVAGLFVGKALLGASLTGVGAGVAIVIGAGVGLVATIVSILVADQQRRNIEDLAKRFGEIALSSEQIAMAAEAIANSGFSEEMGAIVSARESAKGLLEDIQTIADTIASERFKISLGISTDPQTMKEELETYVDKVNSFMEETAISVQLSFEVLGIEGEPVATMGMKEELSNLGKQMKQILSEAFVDGAWIPEKYEEAMKIYQEMQEVLDMVSEAQFSAQLNAAVSDFRLSDLTQESFTKFQEEVAVAAQQRMDDLEEVKIAALSEVELQYKQGLISEEERAQLQAQINKEQLELKLNVLGELALTNQEAIRASFEEELSTTLDGVNYDDIVAKAEKAFNNSWRFMGRTWDGFATLEDKIAYMTQETTKLLKSDSAEVQNSAKEYYEALKPSTDVLNENALAAMRAGASIPENVSSGLADTAALGALYGNLESIQFIMGQSFSTDPEWLSVLATVEGAGESVPESLALGMWSNSEEFKAALAKYLAEAFPDGEVPETLINNLEAMGFNVAAIFPDKFSDGMDEQSDELKGVGETGVQYVFEGAKAEAESGAGDIVESVVDGSKTGINNESETLNEVGADIVTPITEGATQAAQDQFGDVVDAGINEISNSTTDREEDINKIGNTVSEYLGSGATTGFEENAPEIINSLWENLNTALSDDETVENFNNLGTMASEYIITGMSLKLETDAVTIISGFKNNLDLAVVENTEAFKGVGSSIGDKIGTGLSNGLSPWISKMMSQIQALQNSANSLANSIQQSQNKLNKSSAVDEYATGGFPTTGQLFVARESGPEMVGTIGGRTAVANNSQIEESIAAAVYRAVVAAQGNSSGNGSIAVDVYLDGKQVESSVRATKQKRGAVLATGGILNYE